MSPRLLPLSVAVLAALALSACGKQGPLERPGPLFGGPARTSASNTGEAPAPVGTVDRRDRDPAELLPAPDTPPAADGQ